MYVVYLICVCCVCVLCVGERESFCVFGLGWEKCVCVNNAAPPCYLPEDSFPQQLRQKKGMKKHKRRPERKLLKERLTDREEYVIKENDNWFKTLDKSI